VPVRHAIRAVCSYIEDKFDIEELLRRFEVVENLEIDPLCRGTFARTLPTVPQARLRPAKSGVMIRIASSTSGISDPHPDGSAICLPQLMTIGARLATMGQG